MRCHIVPAVNGLTGGAHMVKVMLEALEKAGVPVRYNTKAVELVTDECFNVLGVSCIEKHRRVELMTKGGVILATGGFAGNNAMVGQYIGPWASRMVVRGAPWATGENIRMAEQVMARMVNMDQFYAGPISPVGHCNPSPLMHAGYGIQINTDGRRFVQEHLGQIEKAVGIASLTKNNISYLLIGQDADANNNILSNTLTRFEKLGLKVASGKTIEEAVKQAGLPVEAVMETVAEYNKAVREGKTAELVPPYLNEHPHELKTGPFYLVPAVGGIANTFGGPKIDANARVVNTEDRPIPGLYAAGAAAGGIWYAADVSGSQLGGCMVFGRLAARTVDCAACHAVKTPAEGAEVDTQKCLACHVSLNAVSEKIHARDNAQSPDPHVNHSLGLNCVECHKGHEQSVNMCSRCHLFEYKVP